MIFFEVHSLRLFHFLCLTIPGEHFAGFHYFLLLLVDIGAGRFYVPNSLPLLPLTHKSKILHLREDFLAILMLSQMNDYIVFIEIEVDPEISIQVKVIYL